MKGAVLILPQNLLKFVIRKGESANYQMNRGINPQKREQVVAVEILKTAISAKSDESRNQAETQAISSSHVSDPGAFGFAFRFIRRRVDQRRRFCWEMNEKIEGLNMFSFLRAGLAWLRNSTFNREDNGSTTIEFVIWVPVYVVILTLTVDVSQIFLGQTRLWDVAHVTSRQMSIGEMSTDEGIAYGTARTEIFTESPDVSIEYVDDRVEVTISVAASEFAPFGFLGLAEGLQIIASTTHYMEPEADS